MRRDEIVSHYYERKRLKREKRGRKIQPAKRARLLIYAKSVLLGILDSRCGAQSRCVAGFNLEFNLFTRFHLQRISSLRCPPTHPHHHMNLCTIQRRLSLSCHRLATRPSPPKFASMVRNGGRCASPPLLVPQYHRNLLIRTSSIDVPPAAMSFRPQLRGGAPNGDDDHVPAVHRRELAHPPCLDVDAGSRPCLLCLRRFSEIVSRMCCGVGENMRQGVGILHVR